VRGEASRVKSLMLVAMGMLKEEIITNGKEEKGGSNTFSKLVKDALSIKLKSSGREDSQSSWRLT